MRPRWSQLQMSMPQPCSFHWNITLNLSSVPRSSRHEIGSDTTAYLLDILGRVELPNLESVPDDPGCGARNRTNLSIRPWLHGWCINYKSGWTKVHYSADYGYLNSAFHFYLPEEYWLNSRGLTLDCFCDRFKSLFNCDSRLWWKNSDLKPA